VLDVAALLRGYRPRRDLYPWRADDADPYAVLVSEVMLQQTQARRVAPAFVVFLDRFPTVGSLGEASRGEVLREWGSLGYNRRAVALHEAARRIVREHDGVVPDDPVVLRTLPGVGPYTASAVAALGYGRRVPAIDTNVRRVVSRTVLGREPAAADTDEVRVAATDSLRSRDPRSWNQAVMDLGREICRSAPRCETCPLRAGCRFATQRAPSALGRGAAKRANAQSSTRFEGSSRQARGAILRALRRRSPSTLATVAVATGLSPSRLHEALRALSAEGMIVAGPAALAGRPRGGVALPR